MQGSADLLKVLSTTAAVAMHLPKVVAKRVPPFMCQRRACILLGGDASVVDRKAIAVRVEEASPARQRREPTAGCLGVEPASESEGLAGEAYGVHDGGGILGEAGLILLACGARQEGADEAAEEACLRG